MLIDSLEKVIPWMFALDNTSYSLWLTIYLKPLKEYNPANIRLGEDVLKTSSRCLQCNIFCLPRRLEDVLKTSWRHLENVLKTSWGRLQDVFKRSWKTKSVTLKTSWRRRGKQEMFAGNEPLLLFVEKRQFFNQKKQWLNNITYH